MGVGYAPNDDDEELRRPVPAPPVYGPPDQADSFINKTIAAPPIVPANVAPWPPPVPLEAPGMVPVAPSLVAPTQQPPAMPAAAPVADSAPLDPAAEERKLYAQQGQLADQAVTAEQNLGKVRGQTAEINSNAADDAAANAKGAAIRQAEVLKAANDRTQKWADRADAETEKYMSMGMHDYWSDKSTGSKVLAGLSMLFGAVGRTDNSTNPGMKIVNDAIEKDFRMQQARIEKQKGNVSMARAGFEQARQGKEDALSDNKLKEAAAFDATAAQLQALKMKQGMPMEQAQTDANVVALKQKANQTRLELMEKVHGQNVQDAHLEIARQKEADERLRAEAYAKKMGRGGAGGGGGSLAPISQYIKDHPNDQAGQYALAEKMGYHGAKAAAIVDKLQNDFRASGGAAGQLPTILTDTLTGKDLPVDPSRTDPRKHNAAVAGLPQVNGAIQILDGVLGGADKQHAPEWASYIGFDTSKQADMSGQMTRFRSAYAASKKESVGEANAKELAQAIPDPPSALAPKAAWNNWKKKIESTRDELHETRNGLLANAGVPRESFGGPKDRPGSVEAPPPSGKLGDRDLALKVKAQKTVNDPNADPALKASAQKFLDRLGG